MLTSSDLLHLLVPRDLIEGGIAYAVRSLPHTYDRMGGSAENRLRRIVAGVAVELALRRHLAQIEIPFDVKGATPFTDPDRYDIALGGHRCDVKSFLITYRDQIAELHSRPERLLGAPALVPLDQHAADGHREDDLYLFAFLSALTASAMRDVQKALAAGQPIYLINALPKHWANPQTWSPLGRVSLKLEADSPLTVELGGQTEDGAFITETLTLSPRTSITAATNFFSLSSVHAETPPTSRVAIHNSARDEMHIVHHHEWGNLWVYGMDIYLTGWVSHEEFRQRATLLREGSKVYQYDRTQVKNLSLPVSELRPLGALFEKVKEWEAKK